jgi:hypothetical protein
MEFQKGDEVWILDFPFGRPLNVKGVVIGKSGDEHYNILIQTGMLEGDVVKYKYWKLFSLDGESDLV